MYLTPMWPSLQRNLATDQNFYSQKWMRSAVLYLLKYRLVDRFSGSNGPKPEYIQKRILEELGIR